MKNFILSLLVVVTALSSRPSQAAIGLVAAPAVVTAGIIMAAAGGTTAVVSLEIAERSELGAGILTFIFVTMPAAAIGGVGLLLLDGEQAVVFSEISSEQALNMGLTESERQSFNAEIDQVNALASFVDAEVGSEGTVEEATEIWSEIKHEVSPETFAAMVKVSEQLHNR